MANDAPVSPNDPFVEVRPRTPEGIPDTFANAPVAEFSVAFQEEELGNHDRAIDLWVRGLRHDPLNAEAHMRLGVCLAAIGEHDGALGPLARSMELDPANREAPVRYALSALHVGCAEAVVDLMEGSYRREKEYRFGVLVYAATLSCVGRSEEAHSILQALENTASVPVEFFRNLSRSLMASGQQHFASAVETIVAGRVTLLATTRSRR